MKSKLKETVSLTNWDIKEFELVGTKRHILAAWGLDNSNTSIHPDHKIHLFNPSPDCQNPPPNGFLKLSFDGTSKGNLGKAGYGFILRNNIGKMLGYGYGFLGIESNIAAQIEGLVQGLEWVLENCHELIIMEGDSQMVIHLTSKLHNGSQSSKVSSSWCLESRITTLRTGLIQGKAVSFTHVHQNDNKMADFLANMGVGACQPFRAQAWNMLSDMTAQSRCQDLISSDCISVQMEGRNN